MLNTFLSPLVDFFSQPFGAFGAFCIMMALTLVNSDTLLAYFRGNQFRVDIVFNLLNLAGALALGINAILRDEIVWMFLETYLFVVAVKGMLRARRRNLQEVAEQASDSQIIAGTSNSDLHRALIAYELAIEQLNRTVAKVDL